MAQRIAWTVLAVVMAAALVALGFIVTDVLSGAAQCGGDLLRNCP